MKASAEATAEISVIRSEVEGAADAILSAASYGLALVARVRSGNLAALDDLDATFCVILEACAFQDLTGQRLSRLNDYPLHVSVCEDVLLQGPASAGAGLSQDGADRLLDVHKKAG